MTKTEKILKLLEDNGLSVYDLTKAYWELHIDDYISCCTDFEGLTLADEDYEKVIDDVLSDDEMWNKVDDTIDYFIRHDVDVDLFNECKDIVNNMINNDERAVNELRSLLTEHQITTEQYDYIMKNWDNLIR